MGDARQATCPYCGTIVERVQPVVSAHPVVSVHVEEWTRPQPRRLTGLTKYVVWALVLFMTASILGIVYILSSQEDKIFPLRLSVRQAIPIPAEYGRPLDALILTYSIDGENYTLVYLDGNSQTVLWQSQPLSEEPDKAIIPGDSLIYLDDQTQLLALNRSDGTLAWKASLADVLCRDCLKRFGNRLVALTEGGTLQGFNAQTGALVWSKRLTGTPNRLLTIAGRSAVLDPTESDIMALHILNAENGDVVQRIAPLCEHSIFEEDLDLYSPVIFTPSDGALYLLFGNLATCVQRWDTNTGEMTWSTVIDEVMHWHFTSPLLADSTIYLSEEHDGKITAINTQDGRPTTLTDEPDYDLTPLARHDSILIVRAIRTRGSEREELWGLDAASGELRWQYLLQAQDWFYDVAGGQWDCQLTSRGLVVLQVLSDPDQLIFDTLNPHSGVSAGQTSTKLHDDYWPHIAWTDDVAWLTIWGKLYTVDLDTGTPIYTWP